jgi:glycosyltransferase involved in cell wall biosynthesis
MNAHTEGTPAMAHHDDLVSVLIPAFKPAFLREALQSALNQTHGNLEILVGDDSGHPLIKQTIDELADPRITHLPMHLITGGNVRLNALMLWWRSKGRYVRYLYDDDVIYPRSTEVLVDLLKAHDGCAMAWHQRDVIDEHSRLLGRLDFLKEKRWAVIDRDLMLSNLSTMANFIGEPSFTMFDRKHHPDFRFNRYEDFDLRFLWDVGSCLEAAKHGPAVGSCEHLGGFRIHDQQISNAAKPNYVFGCIEWELVFRNELVRGRMDEDKAYDVLKRMRRLYDIKMPQAPALLPFRERLDHDLEHGLIAQNATQFFDAWRSLAQTQAH